MRSDNWYYTIFSIRGWITVLKVPFSTLVNAIFSFKFKALIKLSLQISWLVISIRLWIQVQEHCFWLSFFRRHLSVCSTANKNQTVSYITEANALNSRISASLFNWHHLHDHEHNWDYLCCVSYGSYQVGCECWDWIYGYLNTIRYEEDLWTEIAKFLDGRSLVMLASTSKWFHRIIMEDIIWKHACLRDLQVPDPGKVAFKWINLYAAAFSKQFLFLHEFDSLNQKWHWKYLVLYCNE